jgi:hypothetical protein
MPDETLPTPEQVNEALAEKPLEEKLFETEEERAVAKKLLPALQDIIRKHYEALQATELAKAIDLIKVEAQKQLQAEIEKFRKANQPLTAEELEKLSNQEYIEYKFHYKRGGTDRVFVIGELSARLERKLIQTLKKSLGASLKEVQAFDWSLGNSVLERIERLIDMVPGVIETTADCVSICLNPFGEEKDMDADWVLDHMTVQEMFVVLRLQTEANRWRDFFSHVSHLMTSQMIA